MASNNTKPASSNAPLSFMQPINTAAAIYNPPNKPPSKTTDPSTILILGWFAAADAHIAKYIAQHRTIFPSSRIILIRSSMSHFFYGPSAVSDFQPVLDLLLSDPDLKADKNHEKLLLHVFSNGGVNTLAKLTEMCPPDVHLPRHIAIFDSCPSTFSWGSFHSAMKSSLPLWAIPPVHLTLAIYFVIWLPFGYEPSETHNGKVVNGPNVLAVQRRRMYLYGPDDEIVSYQEVEKHAAKAEEAGFEVSKETFAKSRHVAHSRVDPERYWATVKAFWLGQ